MKKQLRDYQKIAVDILIRNNRGLLIMSTGGGKSMTMVGLYEKINPSNCLVIVPTSALVDQMTTTFTENLTEDQMKTIFISTWQGLAAKMRAGNELPYYEMILADESHMVGVETNYYDIAKTINPKYLYAVTATNMRFDGTKELEDLCDNHKHVVPIDILYNGGCLVRPTIKFVQTGFDYDVNNLLTNFERTNFSFEQKLGRLKSYIGTDQSRNDFIINYLNEQSFNCALVLSYTTEQTERLYESYRPKNMFEQKHLIHGKLGVKAKREFFETIDKQTNFVVFATQSFLGTGIDIPKLDTLVLATPFGGGAKTIQFAGRILRPYPGKQFVNVHDLVDDFGELGQHWANGRRKKYDLLVPKYEDTIASQKVLSLSAIKKELADVQRDFEIKYNWLEAQPKDVQEQYVDAMLALNHKIRVLTRKIAFLDFTK